MPPDGIDGLRRIGMVSLDHGLEIRRVLGDHSTASELAMAGAHRPREGHSNRWASRPRQVAGGTRYRCYRHDQWPMAGGRPERGSVIIMSAKDDPEDTIRPRLEAAGADLTSCHAIGCVRDQDNRGHERKRGFSIGEDLPLLAAALRENEMSHWSSSTRSLVILATPIAIAMPKCGRCWRRSRNWR